VPRRLLLQQILRVSLGFQAFRNDFEFDDLAMESCIPAACNFASTSRFLSGLRMNKLSVYSSSNWWAENWH
jgi:hypothetical protein